MTPTEPSLSRVHPDSSFDTVKPRNPPKTSNPQNRQAARSNELTHPRGPAPTTGGDGPPNTLFAAPKSLLAVFAGGGADSSSPCPDIAVPLPGAPPCAAVAVDTGTAGGTAAGGTAAPAPAPGQAPATLSGWVVDRGWTATDGCVAGKGCVVERGWDVGGGGGGNAVGITTPLPPAARAVADFPEGDLDILDMSEDGDRIEVDLAGLPNPERTPGGVPARRCCCVGEGSGDSMPAPAPGAAAAMVARRFGEDKPVLRVDLARAAAMASAVAFAAPAGVAAATGADCTAVTAWRST